MKRTNKNWICLDTRKILNSKEVWHYFDFAPEVMPDKIELAEISKETWSFRKMITAGMIADFIRNENPVYTDPLNLASQFLNHNLDEFFNEYTFGIRIGLAAPFEMIESYI